MTGPFLAITEAALNLLHATHADFSQVKSRQPALVGRLQGFADFHDGIYDFTQVRAQSEYLRLVSIVEAYVDSTSDYLFKVALKDDSDLVRALGAAAQKTAVTGWEERKSAYNNYHSITIGSCARYSDIDAAILVRNAIAHGLGTLTPRQRTPKDRQKVRSVDVGLRGNALHLSEASITRCLGSSINFITDIDRKLGALSP